MTTINLNQLTDYERAFVTTAVKDFNDLMFTDDLNHGIPKKSLGGVVASLVKKGIIIDCSDSGDPRDKNVFVFTDNDDVLGYNTDEAPVLVEV